MNTELKHGDKVTVKLLNGRRIEGHVNAVFETVSGTKVRVTSGEMVVVVNQNQVEVTS